MSIFQKLLRVLTVLVLWGSLFFSFGYLFLQRFPLNGVRHFSFVFDGKSPWLGSFQPAQRVTEIGPQGDWVGQRIFAEPVYASARLPGQFDQATVVMQFRPNQQSLSEFGIVRREEPFQAELIPIWSRELSTSDWKYVEVDGRSGYVRTNLDDRVLLTSSTDRVLTWHATSTVNVAFDQLGQKKMWQTSLRGAHDFYFIAARESIEFRFLIQDVNRTLDQNIVAFQFSKDEQILKTDSLSTGGSQDNRPDKAYEKTFLFSDLSPGVYKLSVIAQDDVFIRGIETNALRWVIGPRLFVGDQVGWATSTMPARFWTNAYHAGMQVLHPDALQTVLLGSASATIQQTHTYTPIDRRSDQFYGARFFYAPKGNVRILADGYFAFEESALFLPRPRRLTASSRLIEEGIVAVLTPYRLPFSFGDGWFQATTTFSLPGYVDSVKYTLAIPGIQSDAGGFDVRRFSLYYQRPPLTFVQFWRELRKEFGTFLRRI